MTKEDYGTEITFEELKGHYNMHFLSASSFMELVNEWHKSEVKKLNLPSRL